MGETQMFQEMNISDLLAQGWEYRGEGNANIAISLPKIQKILRIPKTEKPKGILGWIIAWLKEIFKWDYKKLLRNERQNLHFYNLIMVPLFGEKFVQPAVEVKTYPSIIRKLEKQLVPLRPENRTHKRLQVWIAAVLTDYTFLPKHLDLDGLADAATFSIEIKPKQGWIPLSERNFDKCLFCLNQFLKLKNGQIKEMSLYCPLDLFSGQKERIVKALRSLIYTPQNNFKVFINGSYYYGDGNSLEKFKGFLQKFFGGTSTAPDKFLTNFCFLLQQALLKNFETELEDCVKCDFVEEANAERYKNDICIFSDSELPKGCVLERILNVQKLDRLGVNKYKEIYNNLNKSNKFEEWNYVDQFLHKDIDLRYLQNNSTQSDLNLIPYLLAAVAYDCSFMVTLRKLKNKSEGLNGHHVINDGVNYFMVNIGVFDLYPKPANTILKHIKRNTEMLNASLSKRQRLYS